MQFGAVESAYDQTSIELLIVGAAAFFGAPMYSDQNNLSAQSEGGIDALGINIPIRAEAIRLFEQSRTGTLDPNVNLRKISRRLTSYSRIEDYVLKMRRAGGTALREHQQDVFDDFLLFVASLHEKGWVQLPTGAGKTALFLHFAQVLGLRALVLVPRLELIDQTIDSLKKFDLDLNPTKFFGEEKNIEGQLVVSTYQSLGAFNRLAASLGESFPLVLADEAHGALTGHRLGLLDDVPGAEMIIAFSATPHFNKEKSVENSFGECIHEMQIREGVQRGILSGVRWVGMTTNVEKKGEIKLNAKGDYNERDMRRALDVAPRNAAAISLLKQEPFAGKRTAAFCCGVNHSINFAKQCNDAGIPAAAVYGDMSRAERAKILKAHEEGEILVLCSDQLLIEGWDSPLTEIGLMLRPTRSLVVAEQRGGRVLRPFPESVGRSKLALIVEFVDPALMNHQYPPVLFSKIMGDTAELLPNIEARAKGTSGHTTAISRVVIPIEGFKVIFEEAEVVELGKRAESATQTFSSIDEIKAVLSAAKLEREDLTRQSASSFFHLKIETIPFMGSGQALVRAYLRDIRNIKGRRPEPSDYLAFLRDIYGGNVGEELRAQSIENCSNTQMQRFLEKILFYHKPSDIEKTSVVMGPPGKQHEVLGEEIFAVFGKHRSGKAIPITEDGIGQLVNFAFKTAKARDEYLQRRRQARLIGEEDANGNLTECLLQFPDLLEMSPIEFSRQQIPLSDGITVSGDLVLEYFGVRTFPGYLKFLEQLCGIELSEDRVQAITELTKQDYRPWRLQNVSNSNLQDFVRRIQFNTMDEVAGMSFYLPPIGFIPDNSKELTQFTGSEIFEGAIGTLPATKGQGNTSQGIQRIAAKIGDTDLYQHWHWGQMLRHRLQTGDLYERLHHTVSPGDGYIMFLGGNPHLVPAAVTFFGLDDKGFRTAVQEGEEEILRKRREYLVTEGVRRQLATSDFKRFTSLDEFLKTKFPVLWFQVTGAEVFDLFKLPHTHSEYHRLLQEIMAKANPPKPYSIEFWPLYKPVMRKIFSDSVRALSETDQGDPKKVLGAQVTSRFMDSSFRGVSTIEDLVAYWLGTKDLEDTALTPVKVDKIETGIGEDELAAFVAFLTKATPRLASSN